MNARRTHRFTIPGKGRKSIGFRTLRWHGIGWRTVGDDPRTVTRVEMARDLLRGMSLILEV